MSNLIYLLSPLAKEGTVSLPMISFTLVESSIDLSSINMLLFTSKQAVVSIDEISSDWKKIPAVAVGKATKKKILELGGEVVYTSTTAYGKDLADDLLKYFSDKSILYIRPQTVAFDILDYLSSKKVKILEKILYKTACCSYTSKDKPLEGAIIIFTSPSSIKCFFNNFEWEKSYCAVLIGKTTQKHLPSYCDFEVADEPLIDACIQKAKEIAKKRVIL